MAELSFNQLLVLAMIPSGISLVGLFISYIMNGCKLERFKNDLSNKSKVYERQADVLSQMYSQFEEVRRRFNNVMHYGSSLKSEEIDEAANCAEKFHIYCLKNLIYLPESRAKELEVALNKNEATWRKFHKSVEFRSESGGINQQAWTEAWSELEREIVPYFEQFGRQVRCFLGIDSSDSVSECTMGVTVQGSINVFKKIISHLTHKTKGLQRTYAWVLTAGGTLGLAAMLAQAIEAFHRLQNPSAPLACNINPLFACGNVFAHPLNSLFGFPNAFIGIIFFAGLLMAGLTLLTGGDTLKKWFWRVVMGLQIGLLAFAIWFYAVSLLVIGSLCIYCIAGWLISIPVMIFGLAWAQERKIIKLPSGLAKWFAAQTPSNLWGHTVVFYVVMVLLVLIRFRQYFFG